jgi:hypothetical protein
MDWTLLAIAASALSLLAMVTAGVSLWLTTRAASPRELTSSVRQLELDLHELFDTVEKWTRRDRVRRLREGREAAGLDNPGQAAPVNLAAHKAALRKKVGL